MVERQRERGDWSMKDREREGCLVDKRDRGDWWMKDRESESEREGGIW